jgi:hypothetical protein
MNVSKHISKLPKAQLIHILKHLVEADEAIAAEVTDLIIRVQQNSLKPAAQIGKIRAAIQQLQQMPDFHPSGYPTGLSEDQQLLQLLTAIDQLPRPTCLPQALQLTEDIMNLTDHLYSFIDDSDGDLGEAFDQAGALWLSLAVELRQHQQDARPWKDAVLHWFNHNHYGCFDNLLPNAKQLLNHEELRQLAWQFEQDARAAARPTQSTAYNKTGRLASIGLDCVGIALQDYNLIEKAVLIGNPQPNHQQMARLVKAAITLRHFERAQYWLQQPGWQQGWQYLELQKNVLQASGNPDGARQLLLQDYLQQPGVYRLESYLQLATPEQQQQLQPQAEQHARTAARLEDAVGICLLIHNTALAAELLCQRANETSNTAYPDLFDWLNHFRQQQQWLACALCYRALINDILKQGRAKAYHHAADYLQAMLQLTPLINDFAGQMDNQQYCQHLRQQHPRKYRFWQQLNLPLSPAANGNNQ